MKRELKIILTLMIFGMFLLPSSIIANKVNNTGFENDEMISYEYISDHEIHISFEMQDLLQEELTNDYGTFTIMSIPNTGFIGNLGKPQLPVVTCVLAVPTTIVSSNVVIEVIDETISVGNIYPAQSPQTDSGTSRNTDFIIDETFYQQDILYPGETTANVYSGEIRDISFVKIEFYPVQYNPKYGTATIYDEITVSLTWDEGEVVTAESGFSSAPFSAYYDNVFTNWDGFLDNTEIVESNFRDTGCEYLIITHPDFYAETVEFAQWKNAKGYSTHLVDTTETGTTSNAIKQYIQNAYDTWNPRPSYLLIVGDAEFVPTSSSGTDLYYATVDGSDYFPDIFHGRIPVDTTQEAEIIFDKIINYEQNPPELASFYENFAVAAYFQDDEQNGYETRRFVRTSEEVRDYLMTENFIGERIYVTASYINPTHYNNGYYGNGEPLPTELLRPTFAWDGDENDITNAIETGIMILNHRDHGFEDGWGDPYFDTGHIAGLTNGELLPVVFSINCLTGRFDGMECFAEEFLRKDGGGAVAVFAATRVSYSGYNDYLCRGFYDAMWPDFDTDIGGDDPMYTLGELLNYGKLYMSQTWGDPWGYEDYTFELFHVFGDPSMEIWSAVPQDLDVSHTLSSQSMEIVVDSSIGIIEDALVCLSQESGFYAKGRTDSSGTIVLDTTSAIIEEEITLVVSIHNYLPYSDTFLLNQMPEIPSKPEGPTTGKPNTEYLFTTSTIDPDGDQVYYMWRWGDGTYSDWLGPFNSEETSSSTHSWSDTANYNIRVKTKDAVTEQETDWSEPLSINVQKSRAVNRPFFNFLENHPNLFPLLRQILGL